MNIAIGTELTLSGQPGNYRISGINEEYDMVELEHWTGDDWEFIFSLRREDVIADGTEWLSEDEVESE